LSSFKGDVYLFLKLILPKADQRKYNLKEKKLIKIFSGIIGTEQEEMLTDLEQGDISETLAKVFFYFLKKFPSFSKIAETL
jgi:DNA ligase 3